jgi:hypothetical protein
MVNAFGIIESFLAFNFIALWVVAPCNLIDYVRVLVEYVTWPVRNSEMYFDVCAFPLWFKLSHSNSPEVMYK